MQLLTRHVSVSKKMPNRRRPGLMIVYGLLL